MGISRAWQTGLLFWFTLFALGGVFVQPDLDGVLFWLARVMVATLGVLAIYVAFFAGLLAHEFGHLLFANCAGCHLVELKAGPLTVTRVKGPLQCKWDNSKWVHLSGSCWSEAHKFPKSRNAYIVEILGGPAANVALLIAGAATFSWAHAAQFRAVEALSILVVIVNLLFLEGSFFNKSNIQKNDFDLFRGALRTSDFRGTLHRVLGRQRLAMRNPGSGLGQEPDRKGIGLDRSLREGRVPLSQLLLLIGQRLPRVGRSRLGNHGQPEGTKPVPQDSVGRGRLLACLSFWGLIRGGACLDKSRPKRGHSSRKSRTRPSRAGTGERSSVARPRVL